MKKGVFLTIRDLKCKEVINCTNGMKLGYVTDAEFCPETGLITSIIVPETGRLLGICSGKVMVIPYCKIVRIGPDVIIVNVIEKKGK